MQPAGRMRRERRTPCLNSIMKPAIGPLPLPRYARLGVLGGQEGLGLSLHACLVSAGLTVRSLDPAMSDVDPASECDVVFLAVHWKDFASVSASWRRALNEKVLVVCTSALVCDGDGFYVEPVPEGSVLQRAAEEFPTSRVVGAFQQFRTGHLELARLGSFSSDAPVVGDDREATDLVEALVDSVRGFEAVWVGGIEAASALEGFSAIVNEVARDRHHPVGFRLTDGGGLRFLEQ